MDKIIIMWEITLRCNLNCHFCLSGERRNKKDAGITFEEANKIIEHLPSNSHISFVGGESFLFPRFMDILRALDKKGITYEITTNGTLVGRYIDELNQLKNITNIYFSIDSYGEDHDKIRGKKNLFHEIIHIIPKIKTKIHINTVILEDMTLSNLIQLYKLFLRLKVDHLRLAYYTNYSKKDVEDTKNTIQELDIGVQFEEGINNQKLRQKTLLLFKKLRIIHQHMKSTMSIDLNPLSIIKGRPEHCKSLASYYRINEDGFLIICHFINNSFLSLIDHTFEQAINDAKFQELRNKIKNHFPLKICNNCGKGV